MTDEPPEPVEEWMVRRIRELLVEGRLDELLNLLNAVSPQPQRVEGQIGATLQPARGSAAGTYGWTGSASGVSEMVAAVESVSPEFARDIQSRSPQEIRQFFKRLWVIVQLLTAAITVYQFIHGEPPQHQQVIQIFEQTVNQTINVVVSLPPPG